MILRPSTPHEQGIGFQRISFRALTWASFIYVAIWTTAPRAQAVSSCSWYPTRAQVDSFQRHVAFSAAAFDRQELFFAKHSGKRPLDAGISQKQGSSYDQGSQVFDYENPRTGISCIPYMARQHEVALRL